MADKHAHSQDVKHGVVIGNVPYLEGDTADIVEVGVAAEAAGWDGVFMGDHLVTDEFSDGPQSAFDPWMTFAAIAARTESLTLGTWVTTLPRRHPWQVARNLATLDRISGGRVLLGTGLGAESLYTTFGQSWVPKDLGRRYDEALDVITGLWTGDSFSYDGEFFDIDEAVMRPTPVQEPRIPIVAGCWWPNKKPFARGAEYDGIMPNFQSMFGRGEYGTRAGSGNPSAEVREMLDFYDEITGDPGEIILPADPVGGSQAYVDTCLEMGATWQLTTHADAIYAADREERNTANFSLKSAVETGPPA